MSISLSDFLTAWYGPPISPPMPTSADVEWLPEPLKEWYGLSARWNSALLATRRIRKPHQIDIQDNLAVFMEDATGDWHWAFRMDDPNLVVDAGLGEPWKLSDEGLAELIKHTALSEATFTARSWRECSHVDEAALPAILESMTQIGFAGSRWPTPGGRVYLNDSLLAEVLPAMEPGAPWNIHAGYFEVRVASPVPALLDFLDEIDGVKWLRK